MTAQYPRPNHILYKSRIRIRRARVFKRNLANFGVWCAHHRVRVHPGALSVDDHHLVEELQPKLCTSRPHFSRANPTLENYQTILTDPVSPTIEFLPEQHHRQRLRRAMVLFTSSLAGFVFAKYKFFGKNLFFILVLATLMIPFQVIMIPLYLMLVRLDWSIRWRV